MSYDERDDDFTQGQEDPGNLRKAVEKANKEKAAAEKALADLQKEVSGLKLERIFETKKVPAALQRIMTRDGVEADAAAVDKWLTDNGSDFGWNPQAASTEKPEGQESAPEEAPAVQESVLTPEDIAAQVRTAQLSAASAGQHQSSDAVANAVSAVESQLGANANFDAVIAALKAQGIPVESSFGA